MIKLALLTGLVIALVVQAGLLISDPRPGHDITGPATDSILPTVPIQLVADGRISQLRDELSAEGCTLVMFMSVNCSVCQRMRLTWPGRFETWADSVGGSIRVLWLFGGDSTGVTAFLRGYDIGPVVAATVSDVGRAVQTFGVIGTPTAFFVDHSGRMRIGVVGDELPPARVASPVCRRTPP